MIDLSWVSSESVRRIAELHVALYTDMIADAKAGDNSVNVDECEDYRVIWLGAIECLDEGRSVGSSAMQELYDYLQSGETEGLTEAEIKRAESEFGVDREDSNYEEDWGP